jgi:hypothetical protein
MTTLQSDTNGTTRRELRPEECAAVRASLAEVGRHIDGMRHANVTEQVRHDELRNGDINWREGIAFVVCNLWTVERDGVQPMQVVRFAGVVVDPVQAKRLGGYDGGVYGARADILATIVNRDVIRRMVETGETPSTVEVCEHGYARDCRACNPDA